jgi:hypothetical protein
MEEKLRRTTMHISNNEMLTTVSEITATGKWQVIKEIKAQVPKDYDGPVSSSLDEVFINLTKPKLKIRRKCKFDRDFDLADLK